MNRPEVSHGDVVGVLNDQLFDAMLLVGVPSCHVGNVTTDTPVFRVQQHGVRQSRLVDHLYKYAGEKGKASPYSTAQRTVPELIPVLCSQPAGDVSHKPGGRLPLLSTRPAVTLATLKRPATNFAASRTEARWV